MGIDEADAIVLIGVNPRKEAAVLNARLRKAWLRMVPVALLGERVDLTFDYNYLGAGPDSLKDLKAGHPVFDALTNAKRPLVIVGQGALTRGDGGAVLHAVSAFAAAAGCFKDGWNGFNILHTAASRVGALDMGFLPASGGKDVAGIVAAAQSGDIKTVLLLGAT